MVKLNKYLAVMKKLTQCLKSSQEDRVHAIAHTCQNGRRSKKWCLQKARQYLRDREAENDEDSKIRINHIMAGNHDSTKNETQDRQAVKAFDQRIRKATLLKQGNYENKTHTRAVG